MALILQQAVVDAQRELQPVISDYVSNAIGIIFSFALKYKNAMKTAELTNSIVLDIATRMRVPEEVKAFSENPANANPDPIMQGSSNWDDLSLSGGYSGLLLLFSTLYQNGLLPHQEDSVVHQYVLKIKEAIEKSYFSNLSLYAGLSGTCFALQQASLGGKRYSRMLQTLQNILLTDVEKVYLQPIKENILNQSPSMSALHDAIQGISGVGRYILENMSLPPFAKLGRSIVATLIELCHPISIEGQSVPGWYLPADDVLNMNLKNDSSNGNFNLGLAHGVPGILAFLSHALLKGITVPGLKDSVMSIAHWIRLKALPNCSSPQWPYVITFEEEIKKIPYIPKPCRDAWCYGVPGIARSLYLAGKALNDTELKIFASEAFKGIFSRSRVEWDLPGPGLCHGISGLLLLTYEMAQEEECHDLQPKINELKNLLLTHYHPDHPFGFKDNEPCRHGGRAEVSKCGFLEGSVGILLTLLTVSNTIKNHWQLPLLI